MTEAEEKDAAMIAILNPAMHGPVTEPIIDFIASGEWCGRPRVVAFLELVLHAHSDPPTKDQRMGELLYRWQEAKKRRKNGLDGRAVALVKQQLRREFSDLTDREFAYIVGGHASGRYYDIASEIFLRRNPADNYSDSPPDSGGTATT